MLLRLLLGLLVIGIVPAASKGCLHFLRDYNEDIYGLPVPQDGRLLKLTCLAVRGIRWSLKFLKVTYENWHLEMEFVKCLTDNYSINIPVLTPPWERRSSRLPRSTNLSSTESRIKFHSAQQSETHNFLTTGEPYIFMTNTLLSHSIETGTNLQTTQSELQRILQPWYNIASLIWHQILNFFSRLHGPGIVSCTRRYVRKAFWRWVDGAPFK